MAVIGLSRLLGAPTQVCVEVADSVFGSTLDVVTCDRDHVVVEVTFRPTLELEAHGFPSEQVRISQLVDKRHPVPYAIPVGPVRTWLHRYDVYPSHGNLGQLCLWYPRDPITLKWRWALGFVRFVTLVQKHLWFEEFYRRTGIWIGEDAPHGHRPDGSAHPILDPGLARVARTAA